MIEKKRLIQLTQQLIRINSENPPGNESEIACFVKDFLQTLGIKVLVYEFKKRRSNVVAAIKGRKSRNSLLVTPHLDTVPVNSNWSFAPFKAVLHKGRIYGRGASDDKGNLAVLLEVIRSLREEKRKLSYDLIFAATADEETGSKLGLIPLLEKHILKPQAAVILDADEFKIVVVQKGMLHIRIKITGKSAHGAYPWNGINAIDLALKCLAQIKGCKFTYVKNPYLNAPTVNIGKINGGDKVNIVADWCEFELDIRFLPGMSAAEILRQIRGIIKQQARRFKIEVMAKQPPAEISNTHPLVESLKKSMLNFMVKPEIAGSEGATVITFFHNKNIPAIATGFGSSGCAHASNEYVKVDYLYRGAKVLEDFLKNFQF